MILEIAQIDVKPGMEAEFESGVAKAAPIWEEPKQEEAAPTDYGAPPWPDPLDDAAFYAQRLHRIGVS